MGPKRERERERITGTNLSVACFFVCGLRRALPSNGNPIDLLKASDWKMDAELRSDCKDP